jgi:hypothetical protein
MRRKTQVDRPCWTAVFLVCTWSVDKMQAHSPVILQNVTISSQPQECAPADNILPFVQMLRCIKNLSEDANTLEPLQRAGAIPCLVPMLARREGPFIADMHNQVRWNEVLKSFLFVPIIDASFGIGVGVDGRSAQSFLSVRKSVKWRAILVSAARLV